MDYTQLAQAKAENRYPYLSKHPNEYIEAQSKDATDDQRQAYIDCLNDVKGLYQALLLARGYVSEVYINVHSQINNAIEQFEKIENMNQLSLTEDQKKKLNKLWFIYGNRGKKHTHCNHRYIQNFLEQGEDSEAFYRGSNRNDLTDECVNEVKAIVYGTI